jgi:Ser/Thr protein kinase RdoA (MazF antagonist)
MPKFNPEHQIIVNEKNISLILRGYNLSLKSFKLPKTGIENTSIIALTNKGKYVLRVYRQNKKSTESIIEELSFISFLKDNGIPVPGTIEDIEGALVHEQNIGGLLWQCVLLEYMLGKVVTIYPKPAFKQLALVHAKMHLLGLSFAKKYGKLPKLKLELANKFFVDKINLFEIKNPRVLSFFKRAKEYKITLNRFLPMGFNHFDIGYGNILVNKNNLSAVLDFDDMGYGPSVGCLANSLCDVLFFTQDLKKIKEYIKYYSEVRKLNSLEIASIKEIMMYRNYLVGSFGYLDAEALIKNLYI